MAEGYGRQQWAHTSLLCAMIANSNRDPKRKPSPYKPADFDPYARQDRREVVTDSNALAILREALEARKGTP
jgi:hypothetical protein